MARRLGRPKKKAADRKVAPISFRITKELRGLLERARKEGTSERTLTQEIENRLLLSFNKDRDMQAAFGGGTLFSILALAAGQIRAEETALGKRFWEDRHTFDQCLDAMQAIFRLWTPNGPKVIPPDRDRRHSLPGATRAEIVRSYLTNFSDPEVASAVQQLVEQGMSAHNGLELLAIANLTTAKLAEEFE